MTFQINQQADAVGTCLREHFERGVTYETLVRTFGPSSPDGYRDEEKGYDGNEWTFTADDGRVFRVYDRWGYFRIGAQYDVPVEDFKAWVLAQIARAA